MNTSLRFLANLVLFIAIITLCLLPFHLYFGLEGSPFQTFAVVAFVVTLYLLIRGFYESASRRFSR